MYSPSANSRHRHTHTLTTKLCMPHKMNFCMRNSISKELRMEWTRHSAFGMSLRVCRWETAQVETSKSNVNTYDLAYIYSCQTMRPILIDWANCKHSDDRRPTWKFPRKKKILKSNGQRSFTRNVNFLSDVKLIYRNTVYLRPPYECSSSRASVMLLIDEI